MKINKFDTEEYVSVFCEIGEISIEDTYQTVGYFKASGVYKFGSGGREDAHHIHGMMAYAQARYHHRFWLVDFSELSYKWGDEFDMIWDMGEMELIDMCATVVGPGCWEGISTLSDPRASPKDCLRATGTFDNIQDAYDYLVDHMDL